MFTGFANIGGEGLLQTAAGFEPMSIPPQGGVLAATGLPIHCIVKFATCPLWSLVAGVDWTGLNERKKNKISFPFRLDVGQGLRY